MTKIISTILGVALIVFGLFLSFGILVYSLKEKDNEGFYWFILSFGLIGLGVFIIIKGWKKQLPTKLTLESLHKKLNNLGITTEQYYLHGLFGSTDDNDKLSLTITKGKETLEYEIYYKERGEKHLKDIFTTEEEACKYILSQFQEQLTIEKVQKVSGISGMTVNERLWETGLMEEFDKAKKEDKERAAQILRILQVDSPSIT